MGVRPSGLVPGLGVLVSAGLPGELGPRRLGMSHLTFSRRDACARIGVADCPHGLTQLLRRTAQGLGP
jgi:hypothetical protein